MIRRGAPSSQVRVSVALLVTVGFAAALLASRRADAHEIGLSRGDYVAKGNDVEAVVAMARREAISLLPAIDADHDGKLTDAEVAANAEPFARRVLDGIVVEADGKTCVARPGGARLVSEDGIDAFGTFACPTSTEGAALTVKVPLLEALSTGHRHLLKLSHDGTVDEAMLHKREPSISVKSAGPSASAHADGAEPAKEKPAVLGFFPLGIEHILTGWDHLVFLVGLALVAGFGERRAKSILLAVTAFTVAHSITLALAVLDVVRPSPALIEPLIALSVAYVGVENFLVKDPSKRWRVTLPFGLIHGFGFAGALGEVGLPHGQIPAALALFNLGVEAGQLATLAVVVPIVFYLAKQPFYRRWGVRVASGVIVVLGLFWFIERVVG